MLTVWACTALSDLDSSRKRSTAEGVTFNERSSIGARYSRFVGARLSAKLMARVRAAADAHELRVSELVRAAIVEKLAKIEAEGGQ
jgi:hypothetical protein